MIFAYRENFAYRDICKIPIQHRISNTRGQLYCGLSIGGRSNPIPPTVASKLYWSMIIPRLTYGLELVELSSNSIRALEKAHLGMAKSIQKLPPNTANIAVLPTLGWWSLSSHLAYKRLMMLWQILSLPMSSLYKAVLIYMFVLLHTNPTRFQSHGSPIGLIYNACREFGITDMVYDSLLEGRYMSCAQWKVHIRGIIWSKERRIYVAKSLMYSSLSIYSDCVQFGHLWSWWYFCKYKPSYTYKCSVILRLAIGNYRDRRCEVVTSKICQNCTLWTEDNLPHMLFECTGLNHVRTNTWSQVLLAAPSALRKELERGSTFDAKTRLIISGFGRYISEWHQLFKSTCDFLNVMYAEKQIL